MCLGKTSKSLAFCSWTELYTWGDIGVCEIDCFEVTLGFLKLDLYLNFH